MVSLCNRVHELSIIKISVESMALLCCYDLVKVERIKRIKEFSGDDRKYRRGKVPEGNGSTARERR